MIKFANFNCFYILLYHGVSDAANTGIENYNTKHISSEKFIKHLKFLKENCNILSMDEIIYYHENKILYPKNSVAITFDDGFENNYTVAAPLLDKFKIPTAFYISSGLIGSDSMFWVDELEDCINLSSEKQIKIEINGNNFEFSISNNDEKINTMFLLKQYCKNCPTDEKNNILGQVKNKTKINPSIEHSENYKKMNWAQLKEMHNNSLFTIGGHSLNHEILSKLSEEKMRYEISESLNILSKNLGVVRHYSYPEGRMEHFNNKTIKYLKDCGIKCCPTTLNGFNTMDTDLFLLKRTHTDKL